MNLAKADILSAQGDLEKARADVENTVVRAPASGTITRVDIKLGELAQAQKEVMVLQDITNLYIEANINEANIAIVKVGQPVSITYDALGPDRIFAGEVFSIDPSSDTEDGIVNYKIKVSLKDKDTIIRPGMNANITITAFRKDNVLVVPLTAIHTKNGNSYVKVITDGKHKTYNEVPVTVGAKGDGNLVEIQTGVTEGESIIVIDKK